MYRSQDFEKYILPLCDGLMRAAGFRMAYEAAKYSGVNQKILDLFCSIAHEDVIYSFYIYFFIIFHILILTFCLNE